MSFSSFKSRRNHKDDLEARECFPEEVITLTPEQLEGIVGGAMNNADRAYCQLAVTYYYNRGFTLEQMREDMTSYQDQLRSKGQTTLADISAEYLEYMISIW